MLDSELLSLPGIGEKTARILWDRFGSLTAMREAGVKEIEALPGIGRKRAEKIQAQLLEMPRNRR
ncbi:helix-hairpin-helix domain-containing protein [Salidesulfovibrio onnuriiensis]|uniref:helix-hairpin-helix domain-containing protein n=1 Tax=Salidesulfovibrio onnuriiensis TaxID=2583823 RepID=UPI0032B73A98